MLMWWSRIQMLVDHSSRQNVASNAEFSQGTESNMSLISWHSSRLKRVARSSSAAETQAADGDGEAVYIRLCLKEFQEARQNLAVLVVDCRGVYDVLALSSSSCLGIARQDIWKRLLSNTVLLRVARYVGVIPRHSWVML